MVNCSKACAGISQIDVVDAEDMTREKFAETYAHRGQPLVIRNATQVGREDFKFVLKSSYLQSDLGLG